MADDRKDRTDKPKSPPLKIVLYAALFLVLLYAWGQIFNPSTPGQYEISYTQFMEQLNAENIKSVTIKKLQVTG